MPQAGGGGLPEAPRHAPGGGRGDCRRHRAMPRAVGGGPPEAPSRAAGGPDSYGAAMATVITVTPSTTCLPESASRSASSSVGTNMASVASARPRLAA